MEGDVGMAGWIYSLEGAAHHLQDSGFECHMGSVGCAGKTIVQASQLLTAQLPEPWPPLFSASHSGSELGIGLQRGKKASPTILMLSLKLPGPAGQRECRWEESRAGLYVAAMVGHRAAGSREKEEAGRPVRSLPRGAEQGSNGGVRGDGFSHARPCTWLAGGRRRVEREREQSRVASGLCWEATAHVGAAS